METRRGTRPGRFPAWIAAMAVLLLAPSLECAGGNSQPVPRRMNSVRHAQRSRLRGPRRPNREPTSRCGVWVWA